MPRESGPTDATAESTRKHTLNERPTSTASWHVKCVTKQNPARCASNEYSGSVITPRCGAFARGAGWGSKSTTALASPDVERACNCTRTHKQPSQQITQTLEYEQADTVHAVVQHAWMKAAEDADNR